MKNVLAALAALALTPVCPALRADALWFDAAISDTASWPSDGSDLAVADAGVWTNTAAAALAGESGARYLQLLGDGTLGFAIAPQSATVTNVIAMTMRFTESAELPPLDGDMKGGLGALGGDGETAGAYFGLARGAGGTNEWVRLVGAEPDFTASVSLTMTVADEADVHRIRYAVGGTVLADADGNEWFEVVFPSEATRVESVTYAGNGTLSALSGTTVFAEAVNCALTIPAQTGLTVASVKVGGETVESDGEGRYLVAWGSSVVITFAPAPGYALAETEKSLVVRGDTSFDDFPEAEKLLTVADGLRFLEVCGIPDDGQGGDRAEYVVLTNLCDQAFDLAGVKLYIGKTKDVKKKLSNAKCQVTLTNGVTIAAGGTLRLDQADWWPNDESGDVKITNGELLLYIYDADGNLVQSAAADQGAFPSVDAAGASLLATAFGSATKASDWVPSMTAAYAFVRFAAFDGIPADDPGGNVGEWVSFTNLYSDGALDLTGLRFVIGKKKDLKNGKASACDFTIDADTVSAGRTIPAGGAYTLAMTDVASGWTKITNGDLLFFLYDADGTLIQKGEINQENYSVYYGGGGDTGAGGATYLYATNFTHELKTSDWADSYVEPQEDDPEDDPSAFAIGLTTVTNATDSTLLDAIRLDLSKVAKDGTLFMAWANVNRGDGITNWTDNVCLGAIAADQTELLVKSPKGYDLASSDFRTVKFFFAEGTDCNDLEYVSATGSQEVDLDYVPKATTRVQVKFRYAHRGGGHLVGTQSADDTDDWRFFSAKDSGNASTYLDFPRGSRLSGDYVPSTATVYEYEFGNYYLKNLETGVTLLSGAAVTFPDNYSYKTYLFDASDYGDVYYLRFYEGDALVRDYRPMLDGDGVASLYEAVGQKYYRPASGALVAGPRKTTGLDISKLAFSASSPACSVEGIDWAASDGSRQLGDVTISEFMAKNGSTLVSAEGDASDWVELVNHSDHDVNLCGWGLSDTRANPFLRKLPSGAVIRAGERLVVLCDDYSCVCAKGEVHVALGLSTSAGEYLGLTDPHGNVMTAIEYPAQIKDVSCGYGRREQTLLASGDPAEYRVGDGAWTAVNGAAGMSEEAGSFTARAWQLAKGQTANLATAQAAVSGVTPTKVTTGLSTIAYQESDSTRYFPPYAAFSDLGVSGDYYAVEFTGTVCVPRAGQWTFAVGSDDGFRLEVSRGGTTWTSEYTAGRGYAVSPLAAFSFPEAGAYDVKLFYFEQTGGAVVDFSVAEGDFTTSDSAGFNTTDFHLVGSAESGVVHSGALASVLAADVSEAMKGVTDALGWRSSFVLAAAPSEGETYTLRVRYADGLAATVNGTPVASVTPVKRTAAEALAWSEFAIPNDALAAGTNTVVLAVTNDALGDADAIAQATVVRRSAQDELLYFRSPTPGAANTTKGYTAATPKVKFSEKHGYKTAPFELTLTCKDAPAAGIYYTLDGTSPTKATGTRYTEPIAISRTTCVRAAVPDDESVLQYDTSATYLYLDDILAQDSSVPDGFPANGAVNGHAFRYGLNQSVVNGADRDRLVRGLTNGIDTISLVIDPKNLFDASTGIYVNPSGDGRDWERQTMIEGICPTNAANGFTIPGGIRIRGGASRGRSYAKHSLRFFFRSEYGEGSLETNLFGDEGGASFDKVDLRTSQNYSWSNENSSQDTFIHETFSRDSQRDMGEPYMRSRYYHLYINGQYWGLYQTQERGDEDFAETYLGGDADDYDVIKTSDYTLGASAGTIDAYQALCNLASEGFGGDKSANYLRAMGRNADGTRNLSYPILLNPTNVMVYVFTSHYTCDGDSPSSVWGGFANNLYVLRNRYDDEYGNDHLNGFFYLRHDAEHSMGTYKTGGNRQTYCRYDIDPTGYGTTEKSSTYGTVRNFTPAQLHYRLCDNDEYRMAFADQVYRNFLKPGGPMTPEKAWERFAKRMAEIDDAIVGESARWARGGQTRATWLAACEECRTFINNRLAYMIPQYRARGWYPSIDVPTAVANESGDRVTLAAANDGVTLYYTTDGSDPRLAGGGVAAGATAYSSEIQVGRKGLKLRIRARTSDGEWSALEECAFAGVTPPFSGLAISIR